MNYDVNRTRCRNSLEYFCRVKYSRPTSKPLNSVYYFRVCVFFSSSFNYLFILNSEWGCQDNIRKWPVFHNAHSDDVVFARYRWKIHVICVLRAKICFIQSLYFWNEIFSNFSFKEGSHNCDGYPNELRIIYRNIAIPKLPIVKLSRSN